MTVDENSRPLRKVRSFVLRTGRMTESQVRGYEQDRLHHGLQVADGIIDQTRVFGRIAPLVFEIGFGMGWSLAEMAETAPDKDFIGVEVHKPGVGKLLSLIRERKIPNVRVYEHDAVEVLQQCIPDGSLDTVQIYFPDPWHKKKHKKRRLVQPAFVALLEAKLRPGGMLHLATDWEDYADQMMEVMTLAQGFVNMAGEYAFAERPSWRPQTKFERRGENLGHGVWDLLFSKAAN